MDVFLRNLFVTGVSGRGRGRDKKTCMERMCVTKDLKSCDGITKEAALDTNAWRGLIAGNRPTLLWKNGR